MCSTSLPAETRTDVVMGDAWPSTSWHDIWQWILIISQNDVIFKFGHNSIQRHTLVSQRTITLLLRTWQDKCNAQVRWFDCRGLQTLIFKIHPKSKFIDATTLVRWNYWSNVSKLAVEMWCIHQSVTNDRTSNCWNNQCTYNTTCLPLVNRNLLFIKSWLCYWTRYNTNFAIILIAQCKILKSIAIRILRSCLVDEAPLAVTKGLRRCLWKLMFLAINLMSGVYKFCRKPLSFDRMVGRCKVRCIRNTYRQCGLWFSSKISKCIVIEFLELFNDSASLPPSYLAIVKRIRSLIEFAFSFEPTELWISRACT